MIENLDDISKTQENIINNSYFQQIKKDNSKKITCKEKNFINFINTFNTNNKAPLNSNYHYSKTVKAKNNISFQNTPNPPEKITYRNIYNNRDLINDSNIKKDLYINTEYSTEERNKNKEKKFLNVKDKTKNNYQSFNNLKNFLRTDENNTFNNNNFHLIKSEKKIINLKQNYNNNINKTDLNTTKLPEKSKKVFNLLNNNEESFFSKTENNFFNNNDFRKVKYQGRNIKSLINNRIKDSKMNIDLSNKSTKIKNIFVKHKTQNKFGIINLKFENINKKKEDYLYIKSNNKILNNNNKIKNKENNENNNIINYTNYSSNTSKNNKNYKISNQNKKQNLISINKFSQNNLYNLTPSNNILYNTDNNQDKKIMNKNNNIKICNNQIIYNDNKNIFIQNNYINGKLHNSKEITHSNNQKQIYIKNKSFDNTKPNKQNNYITNLKNWIPIGQHFNNAINNIKNIFLGNNEEKKEEEKNKNNMKENSININISNNIDNSNNNEDKSSIIDDSVIMNSSDVYGTLNFSKSFNNMNNSEKKTDDENQGPKDNIKNKSKKENKNEEAFINSYSNYRETITLNLNLNQKINNNNNSNSNSISKKEKEHKKIMLSEIITSNNNNNKDKTPKKEKVNINLTNNKYPKNNNKNNTIPIKSLNNINNNIYNFKAFSVISLAGKNFGVRKTNQDTPVASVNINDIKGFNIFGVLDGHGSNGHYVSQFLRNYLIEKISKNKEISETKDLNKIYETIKKSNYALLINIFLKADEALYKQPFDVTFSGTTCVLVIQIGKKIICANVGDSRAILVYKNNSKTSIFKLSHDFKPDLPEEKKRIYKMGGIVEQMLDMNGMKAGPPRVWGVGKNYPGLAMSRSLGDFKGKKYGIISLPEIIEVNLDENVNYIVICSDGVWEFLSNENVMYIGNEFYEKNDVNGFTKKLAETSEKIWEQKDVIVDDITAVAVFY